MRLACLVLLTVAVAVADPAAAQSAAREADTSQQGGAVRAMGRVGGAARSQPSGIEIPNYGGDISAVRRLPVGTSGPRSRGYVRAPRAFRQHFAVSGQFEPTLFAAFP